MEHSTSIEEVSVKIHVEISSKTSSQNLLSVKSTQELQTLYLRTYVVITPFTK